MYPSRVQSDKKGKENAQTKNKRKRLRGGRNEVSPFDCGERMLRFYRVVCVYSERLFGSRVPTRIS